MPNYGLIDALKPTTTPGDTYAKIRAAQELSKVRGMQLAAQNFDLQEKQRTLAELGAKRQALSTILGQKIDEDTASGLPVGVRGPAYLDPNAGMGPQTQAQAQPTLDPKVRVRDRGMKALIDAGLPEEAQAYDTGTLATENAAEDRARDYAHQGKAENLAQSTLDERTKNDAAARNIAWFVAQTNRNKANAASSPFKPKDVLKARVSKDATVQQLDNTLAVVDRLANHPGLEGLTGVRGAIKMDFPGGKTRDAEALRQQLTAQSAFSELQKMRASSPTGGALGQVSDKEEQMLSNAAAALQRGQSPEQFKANLSNYRNILQASKEAIQDAYSRDYEGGAQQAPASQAPATGADLNPDDWEPIQ